MRALLPWVRRVAVLFACFLVVCAAWSGEECIGAEEAPEWSVSGAESVSGLHVGQVTADGRRLSFPGLTSLTQVDFRAHFDMPRSLVQVGFRLGVGADATARINRSFVSGDWAGADEADADVAAETFALLPRSGTWLAPESTVLVRHSLTPRLAGEIRDDAMLMHMFGLGSDGAVTFGAGAQALGTMGLDGRDDGASDFILLRPADFFSNTLDISFSDRAEDAVPPSATLRHRLRRQLGCVENDGRGLIISAGNVDSDSVDFIARAFVQRAAFRFFGVGLKLGTDYTRPLRGCTDGEEEMAPRLFYQVNPTLAYVDRSRLWDYSVEGGIILVAGQEVGDGAPDRLGQVDYRPSIAVSGRRRLARGQVGVTGGAEVATLLGQVVPTYNFRAGLLGEYRLRRTWLLTSRLSAIRSTALGRGDSPEAVCLDLGSVAAARLGIDWRPLRNLAAGLVYDAQAQLPRWKSACDDLQDGDSSDLHAERILLNSLRLSISLSFGGKLRAGVSLTPSASAP